MTLVAAASMVLIALFTLDSVSQFQNTPHLPGEWLPGLWVVGTGKTDRSTTIIIFVTSNFGKYYAAVTLPLTPPIF